MSIKQAIVERTPAEIGENYNKAISVIGVGLFVFMILAVAVQILNRWILSSFGINLVWTEGLTRFILVIITFFGAAVASRDNEHVKISIIMRKLPHSVSRILALIGNILILIFLFALTIGAIESFFYNINNQFHTLPIIPPFTVEYTRVVAVLACAMIASYIVRDSYNLVVSENAIDAIYGPSEEEDI